MFTIYTEVYPFRKNRIKEFLNPEQALSYFVWVCNVMNSKVAYAYLKQYNETRMIYNCLENSWSLRNNICTGEHISDSYFDEAYKKILSLG